MKYILVTGGVCSGIGKGIMTSSIGALLKACNVKVTAIKIDPYHNLDAGTFSPYEHGEVFVLDDGMEVDLDLGNYERFLDTDLCSSNNITTGKINKKIMDRERQGGYLGKTVQTVPHFTDAIQEWIEETAFSQLAEICLIELGGTVGDIEVMPFLESLRRLKEIDRSNFCCIHVSLVPCLGQSQEHKSKPTQHSVSTLKSCGPYPDMIVCRSVVSITDSIKKKISDSCGVRMNRVIDFHDLKTIYSAPLELYRQGIIQSVSECLQLDIGACELGKWAHISSVAVNSERSIIIALVGKYTRLIDCYTSVVKALEHACYHIECKPKIIYIESSRLEEPDDEAWNDLKSSHCLIVPGGFGMRGIDGKIKAIEWARQNNVPFLGICLGFQMAALEYARNVLGIFDAHSAEFDDELKSSNVPYTPLVVEMLDYKDPQLKLGGTMRLGLKETRFVRNDSILKRLYGNSESILERHRHRFEINPDFISKLEAGGLKFVGKNEDGTRMEVLELDEAKHPYFLGVQFHPEYKTRPFKPSPPYLGLIESARRRAL